MTLEVSVVICTRNRAALTRDAVASIVAGDELPAEVIVVDQSDDPGPGLVSDKLGVSIRHVASPTRGLSRARNVGLDEARHDVIAFVDDDVVVSPGWLAALVAPIGTGERVATTGPVLVGEAETTGALEPSSARSRDRASFAGRLGRDVLAGGNMAIPRSAVDDVGRFDERLGAGARYPAADDNDYGHRLLEAGYRIAYVPAAVVTHRAWRPDSAYARLRWGYGLGQGGFYAKHFSLRDRYMLGRFARHALQRIVQLPVRTAYDRRRLRGDTAFLAGLVWGAARWLLRERS